MQSPEFVSPPRGHAPETQIAPKPDNSADVRAALIAIALIFVTLPFTAAAWLFGWGLTGAAWNYAARMWGGG